MQGHTETPKHRMANGQTSRQTRMPEQTRLHARMYACPSFFCLLVLHVLLNSFVFQEIFVCIYKTLTKTENMFF